MVISKGFHLKGLGYIDNVPCLWYLLHAGWGWGDYVVWQSRAAWKIPNTMFKCQRTSLNGKSFSWPCSQKSLNRDGRCACVDKSSSRYNQCCSYWITFTHICMSWREQSLWFGRKAMPLYWLIYLKDTLTKAWLAHRAVCMHIENLGGVLARMQTPSTPVQRLPFKASRRWPRNLHTIHLFKAVLMPGVFRSHFEKAS